MKPIISLWCKCLGFLSVMVVYLRRLDPFVRAYMAIAPNAYFVRLRACQMYPKAFLVRRRVVRIEPSLGR